MRLTKAVLAVVLAFGIVAVPALAEDIYPPPWRFGPNTTWAVWEFLTPATDPPPDVSENIYGPYTTAIIPMPMDDWYPEYQGGMGVWPLSGHIDIDIWNHPEPLAAKHIWIQITWLPMVDQVNPFPVAETTAPFLVPGVPIKHTVLPGGWIHSTFWIEILPNPEFEHIHIGGDIYIDELVIDTICTDAPPPPPTPVGGGIPTVSAWGVVAMTLLVLAAGTIVFRRFRAVA
jgi:hypothetical protein